MSCWETIADYGLRSLGIGERLLPREGYTLCQQFTLIGSGMIWNVYFAVLALASGFFLATAVALGKASRIWPVRKASEWFILLFRGSPLFIQFFFAYFVFLNLKSVSPIFDPLPAAWITFPTMLRLARPAYTNEAIFLAHATTLVFFSGFPAWQQRGDALYYANFFADKTFNPFVPYPILAFYFILFTLTIIGLFGLVNRRLNRHLPQERRQGLRIRVQIIR